MEELTNSLLYGMVAAVIFAAILFPIVYNTYNTTAVANETFEAGNSTAGRQVASAYGQILAGTYTVYNTSAQAVALTENTDYSINLATRKITFLNSIKAGPINVNRSIAYTAADNTYITSGTTRSMFTYLPIIAVSVILVFFVGLIKLRE